MPTSRSSSTPRASRWPSPTRSATVLYNRGLINAMLGVESIRTAMAKFGNKPMTGEQVRWGIEHLDLTRRPHQAAGLRGHDGPLKVSCADHEGTRPSRVHQWDGKQWNIISDWYTRRRRSHHAAGQGRRGQVRGREEDHAARLLEGELKPPTLAHPPSYGGGGSGEREGGPSREAQVTDQNREHSCGRPLPTLPRMTGEEVRCRPLQPRPSTSSTSPTSR